MPEPGCAAVNVGVTFAPARNCWEVDLFARMAPQPGKVLASPDFFFNLTIDHFGSFGG